MTPPRGVYHVKSRMSDKVLDVPWSMPVPGVPVVQWDLNGGANQKWELVPLDNGRFHLVVQLAFKQLLAIGEASKDNGRPAIQWPPTRGPEQEWQLVDKGNGYFSILNAHSGKALDVFGNSPVAGTPVIQWAGHNGHNQQWKFMSV